MTTRLNTMNIEEHTQLSRKIEENLIQSSAFQRAETIGITISRFPEVNTRPMIETAWSLGKKIAVPRCYQETRAMDFRLLTSFNELERIYIDLLEPIVERTEFISKDELDLQIVPGIVFSNEGFRIGFGGGYYDRYMRDYDGESISLAFECQTNQYVPAEQHDIPVNMIITENNWIDTRKNRELI